LELVIDRNYGKLLEEEGMFMIADTTVSNCTASGQAQRRTTVDRIIDNISMKSLQNRVPSVDLGGLQDVSCL
jgi:hypothetical protein